LVVLGVALGGTLVALRLGAPARKREAHRQPRRERTGQPKEHYLATGHNHVLLGTARFTAALPARSATGEERRECWRRPLKSYGKSHE
jgi:hypothetical protein